MGADEYERNPALDLPPAYVELYPLYAMFKGGSIATAGMGGAMQARLPGHLPNAGGAIDQSAWLMDAFGVIAAFEAKMFPEGKG